MTTINDISDLARILQEQPEWAATLRNLLLTEELLSLPAQLAEFVQETRENNRLASERLAQLEEFTRSLAEEQRRLAEEQKRLAEEQRIQREELQKLWQEVRKQGQELQRQGQELQRIGNALTELVGRHNSIEGRFANYEGGYYERSVRNRVVLRARDQFGFQEPYLAMVNDAQSAPELSRAESLALNNQAITAEEVADLHDADIIVSGRNGQHMVFEVSITAGENDISRAVRRGKILATITGETVQPAIVTSLLSEWEERRAVSAGVVIFSIPFP